MMLIEPALAFAVVTEPSISVFSSPSPGAPTARSLTPSPLKSATALGCDEHAIVLICAAVAAAAWRPTGTSATTSPAAAAAASPPRRGVEVSVICRSPSSWPEQSQGADGPPGELYTSARSRGTTPPGGWFGLSGAVAPTGRLRTGGRGRIGKAPADRVEAAGAVPHGPHGRRIRPGQPG